MIDKLIYQDDQEALVKACDHRMVQVFAPGELAGNIKSASRTPIPEEVINQFLPDKNHFLMHLTAMGATESYGWNRNVDGFKSAMLQRDHPTFVTDGHYFEEHNNRDPKLKRGDIKFSAYHPDLHRVELLVHADIEKAEEDYEMAKAGKALSYSMSVKVPGDRCNCCGHWAEKIAKHCSHIKETPGLYLPEFRKYAYVDNPSGKFFDISKVRNPADRIAHYLAYRFPDQDTFGLSKAASALPVIGGAEWAEYEGVSLPVNEETLELDPTSRRLVAQLASEIKFAQECGDAQTHKAAFTREVGARLFGDSLTDVELEKLRSIELGTFARHAAKQAFILPMDSFIAYCTGKTAQEAAQIAKSASNLMPEVLENMISGSSCCGNLHREFEPHSDYMTACDSKNNDEVQKFMDDCTSRFGLEPERVKQRVIQLTIKIAHNQSTKEASASTADKVLADAYGQYVIKSMDNMSKFGHQVDDINMLAFASYLVSNPQS